MHTISEKQSSAIQRDRQNTKREINILRNDSENTDQAFENTNKLIKKTNDYLKSTLYAVAYNINVEPWEQYFNENTLKELARLPLAA